LHAESAKAVREAPGVVGDALVGPFRVEEDGRGRVRVALGRVVEERLKGHVRVPQRRRDARVVMRRPRSAGQRREILRFGSETLRHYAFNSSSAIIILCTCSLSRLRRGDTLKAGGLAPRGGAARRSRFHSFNSSSPTLLRCTSLLPPQIPRIRASPY